MLEQMRGKRTRDKDKTVDIDANDTQNRKKTKTNRFFGKNKIYRSNL
jgi:hypothetical protein